MKTGSFTRTFPTTKTYWVVEGYSEETHRPMYPHQGWSWTSWKTEITDTYKSFIDAREAISHGYLLDMITEQKIRDIRIFEVVVEREIVERKTVRAYSLNNKPVTVSPPVLKTSVGEINMKDHLILGGGVLGGGELYGRVISIHDKVMRVDIINGGWPLILDISGPVPVIHRDSPRMEERVGEEVPICHIGVPDPGNRLGYEHQLEFYHENFNTGELTSTQTVGYTEADTE